MNPGVNRNFSILILHMLGRKSPCRNLNRFCAFINDLSLLLLAFGSLHHLNGHFHSRLIAHFDDHSPNILLVFGISRNEHLANYRPSRFVSITVSYQ